MRKARGLGRRTSSCWHASIIGARPIDMQVERVLQHHVTLLLRRKRINSGDFLSSPLCVYSSTERREEKKKERRRKRRRNIDSRQSSLQSPRASGCCVYSRRYSAAARAVVATCCDTISGTWKAGRYDIFGSLFLIF